VVLPESAYRWLRLRFGWQWFRGHYRSWPEALAASEGYDDPAILTRVVQAARLAREGTGKWDRDGVVFDQQAFNEPLLEALRVVAQDSRRLDVIDLGGSLGSTWWQHRDAFGSVPVRWLVVEQAHYVRAGKEFQNEVLGFCGSLDEAVGLNGSQVFLCSGALQYLDDPWAMLGRIVDLGFRHVVLDRVPLVRSGVTRLAIQTNPPGLGGRSYPIWLLNERELLGRLEGRYSIMRTWPGFDRLSSEVDFRGWHFERCS